MQEIQRNNNPQPKPQTFFMGGIAGAIFGLLAAYLYNRAAQDDVVQNGVTRNRVSTGELMGLGLAALAMIRQITEMGRSPSKKK